MFEWTARCLGGIVPIWAETVDFKLTLWNTRSNVLIVWVDLNSGIADRIHTQEAHPCSRYRSRPGSPMPQRADRSLRRRHSSGRRCRLQPTDRLRPCPEGPAAVEAEHSGGPTRAELIQENSDLRQEKRLWEWLAQTVEFPPDKQHEFTVTATAMGLSLNQILVLLARSWACRHAPVEPRCTAGSTPGSRRGGS